MTQLTPDQQPDTGLEGLMCANVYALHHAFGRYYQAVFADTGFTYSKYLILRVLATRGPLSLGALSAMIGVEANSLSPVVKKMAHHGLIDRARDPQDERRVVLTLLPYGETILAAATEAADAGWRDLGMDPDAIAAALAVLTKMRHKLDTADPPHMIAPPAPETGSSCLDETGSEPR